MPGDTLAAATPAYVVSGGRPLLVSADGAAILAPARPRVGRVVAFGAGPLFGNQTFGNTAVVPSPAQRALYQLQFSTLQHAAKTRIADRAAPQRPAAHSGPH